MRRFAKHVGGAVAAAAVVLTAAPAPAQFQMAPGGGQAPFNAGAAGAAPAGGAFFSQGGAAAAARSLQALGPYNTMSSTGGGSGIVSPFGGYGMGAPWYNPYIGGYYNPMSGNLYGAAAVIDAENQQMISVQQANLMREQVRREKLENRRRIFEQWLYERANTPTPQDEFDRLQRLSLRRAVNDPPSNEIFSGQALNDLLVDIQKLQGKGAKGQEFPLDEGTLKAINFAPAGKGSANAGLLKRVQGGGALGWPLALKGEEFGRDRQLVDTLMKDAVDQAGRANQVDVGTLRDLSNAAVRLRQGLSVAVREGLPPSQALPASRFLEDLTNSIKALSDANDAGKFVNGSFAAQGRSVDELVRDMTKKGLRFAPSVPGEETAYLALHRAMAGYDVALNGSTLQADQR